MKNIKDLIESVSDSNKKIERLRDYINSEFYIEARRLNIIHPSETLRADIVEALKKEVARLEDIGKADKDKLTMINELIK